MSSIIKIKRSSTQGANPGVYNASTNPNGLVQGEIAVNLFDRKIYVGNGAGVTTIGGEDFRLTTQDSGSEGAYLKLLGESVLSTNNVLLSAGEGVNISRLANGTITFAGEDATTSNKGIASFNTDDFGVTSGAVSLNDAVTKSVSGDSGTATPSGHSFTIAGTSNEIVTEAAGSTVTIGLPDDVTIAGQLNVGENIEATGNVQVGGTLTVVSSTVYEDDISVDGDSSLNGTTVTSFTANSAAEFKSTVDVVGKTTMAALHANGDIDTDGNLTVDGASTLTGDVTAQNTLTVTGLTTLNGGITADGGVFTVANDTGNIHTSGDLDVDGNVNFDGDMTLDGQLNLGENLVVTGNTQVGGNLSVDGNLTVEGALTYLSTSTVYADDGMFKLAANNAADTIDTGIYGAVYHTGNSSYTYSGYFRDASDSGIFKFYKDLDAEPTSTVNVNDTNYTLAQVDAIIDGGTY
jgi:cytoskeletal protein CcmA (bactofilin family)